MCQESRRACCDVPASRAGLHIGRDEVARGFVRDLDARFAKFGILCIIPRFAASALEMADAGGARKEMAVDGKEEV